MLGSSLRNVYRTSAPAQVFLLWRPPEAQAATGQLLHYQWGHPTSQHYLQYDGLEALVVQLSVYCSPSIWMQEVRNKIAELMSMVGWQRVSPITSFFSSPARHSSEEPRICLSPPGSTTSSPSWTPYSLTDEESHLRTADGASCCESSDGKRQGSKPAGEVLENENCHVMKIFCCSFVCNNCQGDALFHVRALQKIPSRIGSTFDRQYLQFLLLSL